MEELQAATKGKTMKLSSVCGLKKHGSFVSLNTLVELTNSPTGVECLSNNERDNTRPEDRVGSHSNVKDEQAEDKANLREDPKKTSSSNDRIQEEPSKNSVQSSSTPVMNESKYRFSLPQIDELSIKPGGLEQTNIKVVLSTTASPFKNDDSSIEDEDFTMVDKDDVRSYKSRSSDESTSSSLEREYCIVKEEDFESDRNGAKIGHPNRKQDVLGNKDIKVKHQNGNASDEREQIPTMVITNKAYETKDIKELDPDMAELLENLKKIKTDSTGRDVFSKDKSPIIEEPKVERIIPIIRTYSEPFIQELSDDASDSGRSVGSHPPIIQEVESEDDVRSEDTMKYREESLDEMDSLEIEVRTPVPHILEEEEEEIDAEEMWEKGNKSEPSDHELAEFELAEQKLLKQELAETQRLQRELAEDEIVRDQYEEDLDYGDYEIDDGSSTDPGFDLLTPIEENSEPTTSASKSASCKTSSDETTNSSSEKLEMKQQSSSCQNVSNYETNLSEDVRSQTFPRSKIETETLPFSNPYYPLEPREVDPELFFQLHTVDSQEELQEFILLESQCHTHDDGKDGGLSAAFTKPKKSRSASSSQSSHSSLSSTKSSKSRSTSEKSSIPLLKCPATGKTAIPKVVTSTNASSTRVQSPDTNSPHSLSPTSAKSKTSSVSSSSSRIRSPKPRSSAYSKSSTSKK